MRRGYTIRVGLIVEALVLALTCAISGALFAQTAAGEHQANHFTYLWGPFGEFVKLRDDLGVQARWLLPRTEALSRLLPPYRTSGAIPNFDWVPRDLEYDSQLGTLYGVFPKKAPDPAGNIAFVILALRLPLMELAGSIDLPTVSQNAPALLVSPNGRTLLVSYRDEVAEQHSQTKTIVDVLDVYDAVTLRKLDSSRTTVPPEAHLTADTPTFSERARFSPDGMTILDGSFRLNWLNGKWMRELLNPLAPLTPAQRAQLAPFEVPDPVTSKPWVQFVPQDQAAGKVLFGVINRERTKSAFWTFDPVSDKTSPLINAPLSAGYLTPDGTKLLAARFEMRQESGASQKRYSTGDLLLFDVTSGRQLREIKTPELAGFNARVVCMDGANQRLFYANGTTMYVISLEREDAFAKLELGFPPATCILADR